MRPRTFILLILVLLVGAVAAVLIIANSSEGGLAGLIGGGEGEQADATPAVTDTDTEEPGIPAPTATPAVFPVQVAIATTNIPIGEVIREDLIEFEERPSDNIAIQGNYNFTDSEEDVEELIGRIARVDIAAGQAILRPMLAVSPTDLGALGSDLSLYINEGSVAIAFRINKLSGAAYAMRPGDLVDVLMSLSLVDLDEEFHTALPNRTARIDEQALTDGQDFLINESLQGRLELIPELELVGEIKPGVEDEENVQIPRRVTQLTIQQAQVLWMGTWQHEDPFAVEQAQVADPAVEEALPTPTPEPERPEAAPDVVILSMPAQDALTLKWAEEAGIDIDLALRAQGNTTVFATTSVTLPQIVEQGGLRLPEFGEVGLEPPVDEIDPPFLPPQPPSETEN